jgi:hypothetical protein
MADGTNGADIAHRAIALLPALQRKMHGFALQYAAFWRPICCILGGKTMHFANG